MSDMKAVFAALLEEQLEVIQMYKELLPFVEEEELKAEFIANYKCLLQNHRDMLRVLPAIMQEGEDAELADDGELID